MKLLSFIESREAVIALRHRRRSAYAGWKAAVIASAVVALIHTPIVRAQSASDWNKTVAAAQSEGEVTVLGPSIQSYRESLLAFEKAYPKITVRYTGVTSPEFDARVSNERRVGRYLSDVVVLGFSGSVYSKQVDGGWYEPLKDYIGNPDVLDDTHWLGGFNGGFLDARKRYIYAFQAGLQNNLDVDRAVVPTSQFSKLSDLLDPRWKGKIAILDPRLPGSGHLITLMQTTLGTDKARQFLTQQQPVIASSVRQLADWIAQGAYPITSGLSPSDLASLQQQGLAKSVQALSMPPAETAWTPGWGALAVLQHPPHPNATKVFVHWLLSKDGQAYWAKHGLVNSRRTDVEPGLPSSVVSAAVFEHGLTFNSEANAAKAQSAFALARDAIK